MQSAGRRQKKSRRGADIFSCAYETATLIFRAAVSLRLHNPMTTCRDTVADGRLICRVLLFISQYPWSAPVKKSVAPPSESSGSEYELYHVSTLLYKTLLRPAGPLRLAGRFLLFSEDKPASKKFFKKFSKRRLLAGSERLCVRLVSGKEIGRASCRERV